MTTPAPNLADELQTLLQQVDPAALLVPPRILRRVIKKHRALSGLGLSVPHRKSYILDRADFLPLVSPAELGPTPPPETPRLMLFRRPDLGTLTADVRLAYWRLLFHSRIHREFERLHADGSLSPPQMRRRIDALGRTAFEEIRDVLAQENLLFDPSNDAAVYEEFACVYLELSYFDPHRLPQYFPGLDNAVAQRILAEDVEGASVFNATRLPGAPDPQPAESPATPSAQPQEPDKTSTTPGAIRLRAAKVSREGNQVRAAILLERAIPVSPPGQTGALHAAARAEVEILCRRLQKVLLFPERDLPTWVECLASLLPAASATRIWNVETRLLYDLQKTCTDLERPLYAVDLVEAVLTLFRRPIKRHLPDQPLVLTVKHLRKALERLPAAQLPVEQRRQLGDFLRDVLKTAEVRLRETFRPKINAALDKAGLIPGDPAERLSRDKGVEELLDLTGGRGAFSIGDLRDALARGRVKLSDLRPMEVVTGDALLKADWALSDNLDGVYRRGEFYMRWLQTVSSLFFGTFVGRWIFLYLLLPIIASLLTLVAIDEVIHLSHKLVARASVPVVQATEGVTGKHIEPIPEPPTNPPPLLDDPDPDADDPKEMEEKPKAPEPVPTPAPTPAPPTAPEKPKHIRLMGLYTLMGLAVFYFPVLHVPPFRRFLILVFRWLWWLLRGVVYDLPQGFLKLGLIRTLLQSRAYLMFWQFLAKPALFTAPLVLVFVWCKVPLGWLVGVSAVVYLFLAVLLNTRLGVLAEEATTDGLARTGRLVVEDLVPGLLSSIVWLSRTVFDRIERFLYSVDESLRFRQGQGKVAFVGKLVLGVFWWLFAYLFRLLYNVFFEPQVNPVKHFPVVTAGHKVTLPLIPVAAETLAGTMGWTAAAATEAAKKEAIAKAMAIVVPIQAATPGMFGFFAWELKENWKLYRKNQSATIDPISVGSHGEWVINLIRPGFHSGTLPKLYARLRRARGTAERKREEGLHHVEHEVKHFVEHDLIVPLSASKGWLHSATIAVGHTKLATNCIQVELCCPGLGTESLWLAFTNCGGFLVANIQAAGWLNSVVGEARKVFHTVLAVFYKLAGVDIVLESLRATLPPGADFHLDRKGLHVFTTLDRSSGATYDLRQPEKPPTRFGTPGENLPASVTPLLFSKQSLFWEAWVMSRVNDSAGQPHEPLLPHVVLLPTPPGG